MSPAVRLPIGTIPLWLVRLLALVALGLSSWLAWESLGKGQALGCSFAAFDCDAVLASGWSKLLGVPVAFFGAGCYLAIFVSSWLAGSRNAGLVLWGVGLLSLLATCAVGAGAWFTGVQYIDLGTFCPFCLAVHSCGLLIALIVFSSLGITWLRAPKGASAAAQLQSTLAAQLGQHTPTSPVTIVPSIGQIAGPALLGVLGIAALVGTQIMFPEQTHEIASADSLGGDGDLTAVAEEDTSDRPEETPAEHELAGEEPAGHEYIARRIPTDESTATKIPEDRAGGLPSDAESDLTANSQPFASNPSNGAEGGNGTNRNLSPGDDKPVRISELEWTAPAEEPPSRTVELLGGRLKIDVYQHAYLGSPDAPHVVVELFDYTCEHCRRMHQDLSRIRRRYGDQVCMVVMPVPLEKRCNRYVPVARPQNRGSCKLSALAICVAGIAPDRFGTFHDWLMEDKDRSRPYDQALVRAYEMFGRDAVRDRMHSQEREISRRVQKDVNLFANLKRLWQGNKQFGLPVLIAGDKISAGVFDTSEELNRFWQESLGIEPKR